MAESITLFLCGDVMLGRGIDQILPHPGDPHLRELYAGSAKTYVQLAERVNGPIAAPVDFSDVWGDALAELQRAAPHARIINLETSITQSRDYAPKGINYKMNPENIACLTAAKVDCCALANNHVLDFGEAGLCETMDALRQAGIRSAGAGSSAAEAQVPAVIEVTNGGRILVFAFGCGSSGIPPKWAAERDRPGVNLLRDLSNRTLAAITQSAQSARRKGDVLVSSVHWGGNWGLSDWLGRGPLRAWADRCRRVRCRPRPFVASSQSDRSLSQPTDPLWLRRFHQRLRGHWRVRGVSWRTYADVLSAAGRGERQAVRNQTRAAQDQPVPAAPRNS